MAIYAYTDIRTGYGESGAPITIPAGTALTAGKESGLTKEQIDQLVEAGVAGEDKHVPVEPNDTVPAATGPDPDEVAPTGPQTTGMR